MPKVSVITPIYKTEKYLDRCLASQVKQTIKDIEFIWIDNGANDECLQIIEKYLSVRPSINVIHLKENAGYAGAMNAGLEIATGEYIGFCDSDDWLDEDYYEKLYETAKQTNSDIVYTSYKEEFDTYSKIMPHRFAKSIITDTAEKICSLQNGAIWNKIFKREVITENQIRFPVFNYSYALDNAFLLPAILSAKQIALINTPYYHYVQHKLSVVHTTAVSAEKIRQIAEWIISKIINKNLSYYAKYELISFFARSIGLAEVIKNNDEYMMLQRVFDNDEAFQKILKTYRKALTPSKWQKLFSIQNCLSQKIFWILGIKIKLKTKGVYL